MQIGVKVGDIMTRNFVSAAPNIPVLSAVKLMTKKRVGSLVLVEGDILRGILTEKDILWALSKKKDLSDVKAVDICTRKITTIRPSADVSDAIRLMKKAKFRRLPVVLQKRVIGFLTLKDILRIQPELFEIAREGYIIKEQAEKIERKRMGEQFKEGICEECGNFNILYKEDIGLVCDDCRDAM